MLSRLLGRPETVAVLSLILLMGYFSYTAGEAWVANMPSLLRDVSWLGMVAIGTALVIICGEFDLSVGSVYAFVSMIFVVLAPTGLGVTGAFLAAMALSAGIGWLNGWLTWQK